MHGRYSLKESALGSSSKEGPSFLYLHLCHRRSTSRVVRGEHASLDVNSPVST